MLDPQEKEVHLLDYWNVLVKRRWVVYASLAVVVTTVTLGSFLMPPVYTASTRLQIERSAPNILPFQEVIANIPDQLNDFYQTQFGLIRSRRVAREVIDSLGIASHREYQVDVPKDPGPGLTLEEVAEAGRVNLFLENLEVSPVRKSRLVDISFSAHDRVLAARAANQVAETYIIFNSEARYNTSERATVSLAYQVGKLQEEVDAKEKELQEYARRYGFILLSEKQDITLKNLNDLRDSHTRAQAARIEKEARYAALLGSGPSGIPEVLDSKLIQDLTAKSAELERRHAQFSGKYKPDWPEMLRLQREIRETRERLDTERQAIYSQVLGVAESNYQTAFKEESFLDKELEKLKGEYQDLNLKEIHYNNLKAEVANRRETMQALVKRQTETHSAVGLNDLATGNIRVVDPAEVPMKPSSPKIPLNILLSLITGLSLGVGMVFFLEYLDKSVKTFEEMHQAIGVACIGLIPSLRPEGHRIRLVRPGNPERTQRWRKKAARQAAGDTAPRVELISHEDPKSKLSEAFREMRTSILVSRPGGAPRTILVTSSQMGEGKTVIALNLAITLAQMGRRILLVDADLRKPRLHSIFQAPNQQGLSNLLSGVGPVRAQFWETPIHGLHLVPSGPLPPNPADLLDSERFLQTQQEFQARGYDHIIYDSPPVLAVADPAILAGRVETVIIVAWTGVTTRDALGHSARRLRQVKARLVGGVLNRADLSQQSYYGYRYESYSTDEEDKPPVPIQDVRQV